MSVYLIHFSKPYVGTRRNPNAKRVQVVNHYIGYAERDPYERIAQHQQGHGARLTQVAVQAGIKLIPAQIWLSGTRKDERRFKNRKNAAKLCPICQDRDNRRFKNRKNAAKLCPICQDRDNRAG